MIEILNIPEKCIVNRPVPKQKFWKNSNEIDSEIYEAITAITWYASIKPGIVPVQPIVNEDETFEEIQIFEIGITESNQVFGIAKYICSKISYPCLLLIHNEEKFVFASCMIRNSRTDSQKNVLARPSISHWLHADYMSDKALSMINQISDALCSTCDIKTIYLQVTHAIQFYPLSGTTKAQAYELVKFLLGKRSERVLKKCTPYIHHSPINSSMKAKYDKTARSKSYTYVYDYEEIWYFFMTCQETRDRIEKCRYRDIEDIIYSASGQGW